MQEWQNKFIGKKGVEVRGGRIGYIGFKCSIAVLYSPKDSFILPTKTLPKSLGKGLTLRELGECVGCNLEKEDGGVLGVVDGGREGAEHRY